KQRRAQHRRFGVQVVGRNTALAGTQLRHRPIRLLEGTHGPIVTHCTRSSEVPHQRRVRIQPHGRTPPAEHLKPRYPFGGLPAPAHARRGPAHDNAKCTKSPPTSASFSCWLRPTFAASRSSRGALGLSS